MNCEMANNYMMKYFDGVKEIIDDAQFKQHLNTCAKCRQEYKCMTEIFAMMESSPVAEPPEDFIDHVMKKVNTFEKKRMEKRTKLLVLLYNTAIVVAMLLIMVFVADIRPEGVARAFDSIKEYFGSFNSVTSAIFGVVGGIFKLIGGVLFTLLQVFISIVKTYYYIFVAMIVLLLVVQRLYNYVAVNDGRKS